MKNIITLLLLLFVCSSFNLAKKDISTSYDTTVGFKENTDEILDEKQYQQILAAGKQLKEIIDTTTEFTVTINLIPNQKESEFLKNEFIGFQRFRKLTSIWQENYGISYRKFHFIDKKFSKPEEIFRHSGVRVDVILSVKIQ